MKKCNKCGFTKQISEFGNRKSAPDGLFPWCKECARKQCKDRRAKIKSQEKIVPKFKTCSSCEKIKTSNEFYSKSSNLDGLNYDCKVCCDKRDQKRVEKNRVKNLGRIIFEEKICPACNVKKHPKNFFKSNSKENGLHSLCKECTYKSNKNRRQNDIIFRLRDNVHRTVRALIFDEYFVKNGNMTIIDTIIYSLPSTIEQYKSHLESLFEPWMNWENHGKYDPNRDTWQIDHIIPQSKLPYDSMDHPNFKKCWTLENLRPLKAIDNLRKGNRIL